MTTALFIALALTVGEVSEEMTGAAPAETSAEAQEFTADPRPVVREHLAEGRRLTALSMILCNFEENGREIPEELPKMLRQAQEEFLKGKGGEFRTRRLRRGETLSRLGAKLKVSAEFLRRVNDIKDDKALFAGQEISVVEGPFRAEVDLSERRLRVRLNEAVVREFEVAVGAEESPTPEGEFKVRQKVRNPQYDKGDEHYKPLDPKNPAGTRWMRLEGSIGIHGTNDPESIGKAASDGCIRLHNRDVETLFDLMVVGSPVIIKP